MLSRCGLTFAACQACCTCHWVAPAYRAISRVLQWVASIGTRSVVRNRMRSTVRPSRTVGRPDRARSTRPARSSVQERPYHFGLAPHAVPHISRKTNPAIRIGSPRRMQDKRFNVGIVVPLAEEFRYVLEICPQLESIPYEGTRFYRMEFSRTSALCCLAGQMGTLPALQAATRLLAFADIKLLVLLGLAGSLDGSVDVGDVVVAEEVNDFQSSSKAQSTSEGYQVRYSGRHWSLDYAVQEAIRHFEFSCAEGFSRWQTRIAKDFTELNVPDKDSVCSLPSSLHIGPIASGNIVAASGAFAEEIRRINRKFLAIDMEAAGIALAATDRIHRVPWLVVRGVSDRADENKTALDKSRGVWRRYSVRNAAGLLERLLAWDGFLSACGLTASTEIREEEDLARELLLQLRGCVGGRWLVATAFGLYSHGPHVKDDGSVVPMDVSVLRVTDARLDDLLKFSIELKERIMATAELETVADEFSKLATNYRNELGTSEADAVLKDLDRVVESVLCPTNDEHLEALLLESDRLHEEVGPEAVVEFLAEGTQGDATLRERLVRALSDLQSWSKVIETLQHIEQTELSRAELEDKLFAYVQTNEVVPAQETFRLHQSLYDDNGAEMFRQQLAVQHSWLCKDRDGARP